MASPTPVSDPNALTPAEIAEFEAQEKVDAAVQTNTASATAPVAPPTPPTPVGEPTPAPVVAAQAVAGPDAPLTPQEIAEFEAQEKAEKPVSAAEGLTAAELAELAVQDPTFVLETEFRRLGPRPDTASLAESQKYNAMFEKFAQADHLVRERGFKWEDRPSLPEVGSALKGFGVGVWKYAKPFVDIGSASRDITDAEIAELAANDPSFDPTNKLRKKVPPSSIEPDAYSKAQRGIAESGAATEASIGGLVDIARKAGGAGMRQIGLSKPLPEWTLEDKTNEFAKKLKRGEASEQVLKGQGPAMQAIGGEIIKELETKGLPIRPEEVAAKTAGDPFALWAFGAGMSGASRIVPRFVKSSLARGEQALAAVAPKIVGKTIEAVGDITAGGAKVVEKTAPTVGAVVGAVKGAEIGGIPGAVIGAGAGRTGGVAAARAATAVRGAAEKVATFGEQVSGAKPMVSDYAQLVRSASQAIPGATRAAGEGLAFDVGLAAVSAESPEDTKGAIGLGTALGVLSGAGHTARHIVSGQVVGPRAFGIATPTPTSANANPTLKGMHDEAFRAMTPAERTNVNAIRKLMDGWDSDFFAGKDAATVEAKLIEAGADPTQAKLLSEAEGFFSIDLPGKDGKPRRTIVARNVAAAPHESFHAFQDVIGEAANRVLDEQVKREYGDQWDAEGQAYADRLPGEKIEGQSWEERILNASGWGRAELVDKMTRELEASNEAQGNPPNPDLIKRLVIQEIARLQAEKGGDPRNVWNGELSAEEAKIVADRYMAREIAAENFDVAVKNRGIGLEQGNSLPQRFARVIAAVISGLGGNPLLPGAVSEIGRIQPKIGVMEAVSKAVREQRPAAKPGEPLVTPKTPSPTPSAGKPGAPGKGIPTTPEQIAEAAAEAQQVADAAPDVVEPGKSASPRELLGTIAQAIADRLGVKINYRSAPGEPAAATTSNRSARRAVVEAFRSMPAEARALWEKNFFPERVIALKGGKYQVLGWSPEAFAANAHKMAKALIDSRQGDLAPYPLDPTTGSFTPEGWQRLYDDTQIFVENQAAGRTGSGVELVVPREVVEAGGYKPPVVGEAKPLEQGAADFINMLFGFKLPETPRMVVGKRPLNIQGQEVSAATIPGRVEPTVRPRAPFTGQEAEAQGIAGREIQEVNPARGAIERALGDKMPSMTEAIQRLNLENINDVVATPEQPQFRANTLTVTAGLQPPRGKGYAADEMWLGRDKLNEAPLGHKQWAEKNFPEGEFDPTQPQLTPYERAQQGGYLRVLKGMGTLMVDASPKYPTWDKVPRGFKSALESRAVDQDLRVTFDGREVIKKFRPGDGDAQFQPKRRGEDPYKILPAGTSGHSKTWILPDGQPVQLGGQWHHHWLDDNPDVAKKYGLDVPAFEGADSEGVREGALKKGFARVNYARNTGTLTVEARAKDWRKQKEAVRQMVEANLDNIDNITVHLLDATATKMVDSDSRKLFDLDDAAKLENLPFISDEGGEARGTQMQPKKKKGYVAREMWIGRDGMKVAELGHREWARENFTRPKGKDSPPDPYEWAEADGYLRVLTEGDTLTVDGSMKYPTWKDVPRKYKEMLEDQAAENDLKVDFTPLKGYRDYGKSATMIQRFKPGQEGGEGGDQFQPASAPEGIAEDYAEKAGITYRPSTGLKKPDEVLMKDLADFYEEAKSTPDDPAVKASYDALAAETVEQFRAIEAAGYTIEPFTGKGEPYASSADMIKDVNDNKHLFYLATDSAFGGTEPVTANLMLRDSGVQINGENVPFNDLFRPVHDFFGHVKDNHQFGPRGEFNAWRSHSGMYSPEAQGALAAETLGQNAWVNFGKQMRGEGGVIPKKGEPGYVPLAERPFGEQKNTVISPELIDRALAQMQPSKDPRAVKRAAVRDKDGKIFEASMHWEAIDKANEANAVGDLEDGFITNNGEFLDRNQAYDRALELQQIAAHSGMRQSATGGYLESVQFEQHNAPNSRRWVNRTAKEAIDNVLSMSAPDFNQFMRDYKGEHANSATGIAIDIGKRARKPEEKLALKVAADIAGEAYKKARAEGDLDTAMAEAMRKQTFEEALQAAERSRPAINELMSKFQFQAPKDEELSKIRSGETFGNTFLPNGDVWDPADKKVDVVTLASTNVPRDELTRDNFDKATEPYAQALTHPDAVVGAFAFEKDKKPVASIDINVLVPQEFRENTKKFATDNQQVSFWDAVKQEEVKTGGSGDTVLKTPEQISAAMDNLVAGKPVDVTAQFVAKTAAGKKFEEEGYYLHITPGILELLKDGKRVAVLEWSQEGKDSAEVDYVRVDKDLRKKGIAEMLYRELGTRLQQRGVQNLTGYVINEGPIQTRTKVFGEPAVDSTRWAVPGKKLPADVVSKIDPDTQYQPQGPRAYSSGGPPQEFWLGAGKLNRAPKGHEEWATRKYPAPPFKKGGNEGFAGSYQRAENAGYLRVVREGDYLLVDRSMKYPTWEKVPRELKETLEARAVDEGLNVSFDDKLVIDQFRPKGDDGGLTQMQPKIPDDDKIGRALSAEKIPLIGAHRELEKGTPIGVRIDIPAYNRDGTYVQTIHEPRTQGSVGNVGKRIGYDGIVTVDEPVFFSNERGAKEIRAGRAKFPVATVEGNYNPSRTVPRDLQDWTEVGYNPQKHSYFYEKGTDEMVISGTKAVSVGNTVYVKDAVFGDKGTAQFQLGEPTSTQPKTEAGKELLKKGFGFEFYREEGGRRTIRLSHKGKPDAATINTSLGMEGEADLNWVFVDADLRKQGIGEALYREMATMLKKDGVTKIIGDPISDSPEGIRRRVFGEPKVTRRQGMTTLTSTIDPAVQYSPKTKSGQELVEKGFRMTETQEGNLGELVVKKGGRAVGYISWRTHPPEMKSAHISLINVDNDFRRQGIAETLYREVAARLQKSGITRLRGSVIAEGPIQAREKIFGEPEELSDIRGGVQHVSSRIDPNAQYQPIAAEDVVPTMPALPDKVSISSRDEEE